MIGFLIPMRGSEKVFTDTPLYMFLIPMRGAR